MQSQNQRRGFCPAPAILLIVLAMMGSSGFAESKEGAEVRRILASRCFRCHGPTKQEGGLRLDRADNKNAAALRELAKKILERVTETDAELRMPRSNSVYPH